MSMLLGRSFRLTRSQAQAQRAPMSGRGGGGGRGRGWYYKQLYGGGGGRGRGGGQQEYGDAPAADHPRQQPDEGGGAGDFEEQDEYQQAPGAARQLGSDGHLREQLRRLDGKSYKAYNDIKGAWTYQQGFTLVVDHVQGDPYAAPSRLRVQVPGALARIPPDLVASKVRQVALRDWFARRFAAVANTASAQARQNAGWGGAKGGDMVVDAPGQHVLERTAVVLLPDGGIEGRFTLGLPARGRSIMGAWASSILCDDLPRHVRSGLLFEQQDASAIHAHVQCVEDTHSLRSQLPALGLVAFVGDGAVLPRKSGASDQPMQAQAAPVLFESPPELAVEVQLPNRGRVRGMGVRPGITLIVGGGFHGKSTLLKAIEAGVYDKVPGDGRELVACVPGAAKVRAEDGRRVEGVDISTYIANLPLGRDTRCFRTDDASGSTSQAANIQEALEAGATALLLDEDTCATNLMMRDARMQALIASDQEPITPFRERIGALRAEGVSSILVMGGSGSYFDCADCAIAMHDFKPRDVTAQARAVAQMPDLDGSQPAAAAGTKAASPAGASAYGRVARRAPVSIYPAAQEGGRGVKVQTRGLHHIQYGQEDVQLAALEQLVDKSQTRAVADALRWLAARAGRGRPLADLLTELEAAFDQQGLDALAPHMKLGNLARPRRQEVAGAVNRLRTLQVQQC